MVPAERQNSWCFQGCTCSGMSPSLWPVSHILNINFFFCLLHLQHYLPVASETGSNSACCVSVLYERRGLLHLPVASGTGSNSACCVSVLYERRGLLHLPVASGTGSNSACCVSVLCERRGGLHLPVASGTGQQFQQTYHGQWIALLIWSIHPYS